MIEFVQLLLFCPQFWMIVFNLFKLYICFKYIWYYNNIYIEIAYHNPHHPACPPYVTIQGILPLFPDDIAFQLPEDDIAYTILEAITKSGLLPLFEWSARAFHGYPVAPLLCAILLAFVQDGYGFTRSLERKCRFDLRYRWLFGSKAPSHMVFQRFIHDNQKDGDLEQMLLIVNEYIETKPL